MYQKESENVKWFASRIKNSNLNFKDKIVSLMIFYLDSDMMYPSFFLPENNPERNKKLYVTEHLGQDKEGMDGRTGIENLKKLTEPDSTTIFKLAGKNSPYRKILNLTRENVNKYVTTDYFQYAVLIRNSKATLPYEKN